MGDTEDFQGSGTTLRDTIMVGTFVQTHGTDTIESDAHVNCGLWAMVHHVTSCIISSTPLWGEVLMVEGDEHVRGTEHTWELCTFCSMMP